MFRLARRYTPAAGRLVRYKSTATSSSNTPSSPGTNSKAETPAVVKPAASEGTATPATAPKATSEVTTEVSSNAAPKSTSESGPETTLDQAPVSALENPAVVQTSETTLNPTTTDETAPRTRGRRLKGARQSTSTEVEAKSDEWKKLGLKYDPDTLPIEQHLDPAVREYDEEEWSRTLIHGRGLAPAFQHQRTHDVPVANIHFRSHQIPIMNLFIHFASHAAASLGIPVSKTVSLPTQRRLWTVLRSPFAHKKSQENFERKVHKRALKAWDAHPDVVQRWVDYLRKHAMPGVGMRVTTWQRVPLGIGASALARDKVSAKDAAVRPTGLANKQIEELAQKIIAEERASPSSEVAASVSSPKSKA